MGTDGNGKVLEFSGDVTFQGQSNLEQYCSAQSAREKGF